MPAQKHVLVAVLDWGLGHATRCVPVINALLNQDCKVTLAGSGQSLQLLRQEFPQLEVHELKPYRVSYSASIPFMVKIFLQLPKFIRAIRTERDQVGKIVALKKVDFIISDNRYGCWSKQVPSVLITHQLNLIMPPAFAWMNRSINFFNHQLIGRFDLCWIPDFENDRITDRLTTPHKLKVRFVGMLSRFVKIEKISPDKNLILGIVSGPEPHRQMLESILEHQMANQAERCIVVRGIPAGEERHHVKINFINHLPANELNKLMQQANFTIARSGYSTVMDLAAIGSKNVILIPTPGQTEQEYLGEMLNMKGIAYSHRQSDFDLSKALAKVIEYAGFEGMRQQPNLLQKAISELLEIKQKQ